jgi:hypothetical protein
MDSLGALRRDTRGEPRRVAALERDGLSLAARQPDGTATEDVDGG